MALNTTRGSFIFEAIVLLRNEVKFKFITSIVVINIDTFEPLTTAVQISDRFIIILMLY